MTSTHHLPVGHLGALRTEHEPPGGSSNSGSADVRSNRHVTEEQPSGDQTLVSLAGGLNQHNTSCNLLHYWSSNANRRKQEKEAIMPTIN